MIIRALLRILLSLHRGDEPCECGRAFDEARALVEANYAGFQDKTAGARGLEYRARTIAAREEAARARNFAECFQAISGWIGFFQDGHTVLIANPRAAQEFSGLDSAAIRALFPDWPRRDWTEAMLRSYLDKNRGSLAPIEGIWETPGYRLAIVRDSAHKDQFLSVVLSADSV